ncbi:MAG: N-acetylmuramoyl-L-alanine amidase [Candidatus Eisenbacteria bacterium]|nr:N-acetylmuramoyl-L-alanine amidase [Candidatus Eisenbacteria bacterium]
MRDVDASAIRGKRIVIDPGHGGVFKGAVGRGGLTEADVNLGVALYLWGLLRDAGAEVMLTRSSDIDFVDGAAGELRQDLARRAEIAASFKPHLFLSLHHNADLARSEDKNQVETYFRMTDCGPSEDVARLVHQRLQEKLQIPLGSAVPGNYFVLRNAPCPAVLGEPSYITNPWVENKLRLAEKLLLEAQAYFLGIAEYFSRGAADVADMAPQDTTVSEARPWLTATPVVDRSAVDPSSVTCELDGRSVGAHLEPSTGRLVARPESPLAGGTHEFCFTFRNLMGNSSGRVCASFDTDLGPAAMALTAAPSEAPRSRGVLVTSTVSDENANPVRDGTQVVFSGSAGAFARETVRTVTGIASTFFFYEGPAEAAHLTAASRGVSDSLVLTPSDAVTTCLAVSDARTGEPVTGAAVLDGDSVRSLTTPQGLAVVAGSAAGLVVSGTGYVPSLIAATAEASSRGQVLPVRLKPVALGTLHGTRITLDVGAAPAERRASAGTPRGSAPTAPGRADDAFSQSVATALGRLLSGAGARVLSLGPETPDEDKVAASERFGAQRYIRIEPAAANGRRAFLHYPGSKSGAELAARLALWSAKIGPKAQSRTSEDAHYVLLQTSCPAVIARVGAVADPKRRAAALRAAYAFFLALLEDTGLDASLLIESSVRAWGEVVGEEADVVLDGFVRIPLAEDGSARFFCEEGVHMVAVESASRRTAPHFVSVKPARRVGETPR